MLREGTLDLKKKKVFLEKREREEAEGKHRCERALTLTRTEPAAWAWALTRNPTSGFPVHGDRQPREPHSGGTSVFHLMNLQVLGSYQDGACFCVGCSMVFE